MNLFTIIVIGIIIIWIIISIRYIYKNMIIEWFNNKIKQKDFSKCMKQCLKEMS